MFLLITLILKDTSTGSLISAPVFLLRYFCSLDTGSDSEVKNGSAVFTFIFPLEMNRLQPTSRLVKRCALTSRRNGQ